MDKAKAAEGRSTRVEQRRIKCLAQYLKIDEDHPFTVEEAADDDWTFSSVRVDNGSSKEPFLTLEDNHNPNWTFEKRLAYDRKSDYAYERGEVVLLIGFNPQHRNVIQSEGEISDLEPTRYNTIKALIDLECKLKELVTIDLVPERTKKASEASVKAIEEMTQPHNQTVLKQFINCCHRIILAWGNEIGSGFWSNGSMRQIAEAIKKNYDKCWVFGELNKTGCPHHPLYISPKLRSIREEELSKIFPER